MLPFNKIGVAKSQFEEIITRKGNDTIRYLNAACAFDIETSSFRDKDDNKRACMYIWMFGIEDDIFYGRTWGEFQWFLHYISELYELGEHKRMIVYVHNLAYEFQFLINHVAISQTFARKKRHPIKTLIESGFELRCSYFLSGLSLENTAKELNLKAKKKVGGLDYRKLRHSGTPLKPAELEYCEYDIKVLIEFIRKEIKKCGNISKIPLTKTGYVREYCKNYIAKNYNYSKYRERIKYEFPNSELFTLLYKAFMGGYTHANAYYLFDVVPNVHSIDFTSSYPTQMIMHKYPRGKFRKVENISKENFERIIENHACVFEIKLYNVRSKSNHHIWSSSKCDYGISKVYNAVIDNGRIVESDCIYTRMTDVDFRTFCRFYKFSDNFEIYNFHYTVYDYLPKALIECILKFYEDKTLLKGVEGKEDIYLVSKGMLNAIYGMMVTNPLNDEIIFDIENEKMWISEEPEMYDALERVKNSPRTFLCFQWGVWVTAWARYELLKTVSIINNDVLYCDTDSIKYIHKNKYEKVVKEHNDLIISKLNKAINYFNLNPKSLCPDGIHHLGVWEDDGDYDQFKTIGAKRYMYIKKNRLYATISGLNTKYVYKEDVDSKDINKIPKKFRQEFEDIPISEWEKYWNLTYKYSPMNFIIEHGGIDYFQDEMFIPEEYSKRLVHTYSKAGDYLNMVVTDYCGIRKRVEEFCYINLEPTDFKFSLIDDFIKFIRGIPTASKNYKRVVRKELAVNAFQYHIEGFDDNE